MDKTLNILIIEDNSDDVFLIEKFIERAGIKHKTKSIFEKSEFLEAIAAETFDIILTDNSMFQFNARDVLNILKSKNITAPLIILSGTVSDESAYTMIKEGAFAYVNKNDFKQITASIQKAIEKINQP